MARIIDIDVELPVFMRGVDQIQADWNQNDSEAADYIKNKPAIKAGTGSLSIAEGYHTTASGGYGAHAEGSGTTAFGSHSHAEGSSTKAKGMTAHAEGNETEANGTGAHAEGSSTKANGYYSHAEGVGTKTDTRSQHAFGEYNYSPFSFDPNLRGEFIETVGNGTSNSDRSNARTLDWSGNEQIAGTIRIGSTSTGGALLKFESNSLKVSFDNGATWGTVQITF